MQSDRCQRVVSKDDLVAAVWDGRIVSDTALFTRINAARTAIGTQARLSGFKRTQDAEHFFEGLRKAGLPER